MVATFEIPNTTQKLYVIFQAEITPTTAERLTAVMAQAIKKRVAEVYLAISTPGGQVQAGMTLFNTLPSMPFELIVHNIGSVNSIGNVMFLAGQQRYAVDNATFMLHGVGVDIKGPLRIEEQFARDRLV